MKWFINKITTKCVTLIWVLQSVVNLYGVVNKIEIHKSTVIRNRLYYQRSQYWVTLCVFSIRNFHLHYQNRWVKPNSPHTNRSYVNLTSGKINKTKIHELKIIDYCIPSLMISFSFHTFLTKIKATAEF